ncbi:MAG: agmatine deiminase family protein [Verrucomicrobiota bacterium]
MSARWIIAALFLIASISTNLMGTVSPKSLGYRFPDEWEDRQGTMMIFPSTYHYGRDTAALRREFLEIAKAIAANEAVTVFCSTADQRACRRLLGKVPNLTIQPGNFTIDWARDNAPMLLRRPDGSLASAGFRFNGWGKKYPDWENDADTRDNISKAMGWPVFHSDLVLEGGAIEIGGGIGIVTESCVLNPNRTDWPKAKVEDELKRMLGLRTIIWIESGLMPDPITDGHVDGLVKFVAEDTVLLHTTGDRSDINYRITQDAKKVLQTHGLKIIELPLAGDFVHINFYIGSGGDIAYVPILGDPKVDDPALATIRELFKEVIPIVATRMAEHGGGIHCYTMQIPR